MTTLTPIKILLVDDHPLVLNGISAWLGDEENIQVVGTAGNGKEALEKAKETKPDVVLMDISMPVMDGLEAIRHFKEDLSDIRVLILSMHDEREYIVNLMQAGAYGYVLKDAPVDELIKAIEAAYQGSSYLSAGISKRLFNDFYGTPGSQKPVLTKREETVLKLIAEGKCNKNIARALDISVRTVETHRRNITTKLDIHTPAGLTKHAIKLHLVELP